MLSMSQLLRSSAADLAILFMLTTILIPAAIADYRSEKIPNFFSMAGWFAGPAVHYGLSGMDGLLYSGMGFGLLFAITFPLWLINWFGAADVKLIASVGAIVGGIQALTVLLGIFLAGLVMALLVMVVRGELIAMLRALYYWQLWGRIHENTSHPGDANVVRKDTIPYAIPIAFGSLLTILYSHL